VPATFVDRQSHASSELKNISPVTFVMSHKDGWLWHIVLREKTSVGLIVSSNKMRGLDKQQREIYFQQSCARLPHLKELLSDAQFMDGSLPKMCPVVWPFDQDGPHSRTELNIGTYGKFT
jgi:hypothetical protein